MGGPVATYKVCLMAVARAKPGREGTLLDQQEVRHHLHELIVFSYGSIWLAPVTRTRRALWMRFRKALP
jgi:hypothetical protein